MHVVAVPCDRRPQHWMWAPTRRWLPFMCVHPQVGTPQPGTLADVHLHQSIPQRLRTHARTQALASSVLPWPLDYPSCMHGRQGPGGDGPGRPHTLEAPTPSARVCRSLLRPRWGQCVVCGAWQVGRMSWATCCACGFSWWCWAPACGRRGLAPMCERPLGKGPWTAGTPAVVVWISMVGTLPRLLVVFVRAPVQAAHRPKEVCTRTQDPPKWEC